MKLILPNKKAIVIIFGTSTCLEGRYYNIVKLPKIKMVGKYGADIEILNQEFSEIRI